MVGVVSFPPVPLLSRLGILCVYLDKRMRGNTCLNANTSRLVSKTESLVSNSVFGMDELRRKQIGIVS